MGLLHRVLQNLLRVGIPIRNLTRILETLGDHAASTKDPALLTELVRKTLARTITERHSDDSGTVRAITLQPNLEYELRGMLTRDGASESLALAPDRALDLSRRIGEAWRQAMGGGHEKAVLLCDYRLRPHLAAMLSRQLPDLPVLAYDEVAVGTEVESVATVGPGGQGGAAQPAAGQAAGAAAGGRAPAMQPAVAGA
jgi:flagellar biosynthesis protein FlhA